MTSIRRILPNRLGPDHALGAQAHLLRRSTSRHQSGQWAAASWDDYLERVGRFHARWQAFFVDRARRGAALTSADYSQFPRFDPSQAQGLGAVALRVASSLTWVGSVACALMVSAARQLSRSAWKRRVSGASTQS